jgi:mannose/fructose/N-acetylgalactosamine-specific phosphotransferase system component IIC
LRDQPRSLTGFTLAFWVGVGFAVIALATAFIAFKREDLMPQAQPGESPREEADDEQLAA